ncbi:sensor histidine kinase [Arcicella rigui]|uniref:Histidine kinase n=1 Tax=Arcicella rigui TaxID=797020 RepID=A0ABU5Q9C2_9BACT|nr:histidine kinase [Arcicella rigui]MEA5139247.1 histidine kinase [Arcicella rigui]
MWKSKNIIAGISISIFIGALVFLPKPNAPLDYFPSWANFAISFLHVILIWLFVQWLVYQKHSQSLYTKVLISIGSSVGVSIIGFFLILSFPAYFPILLQYPVNKVSVFILIRAVLVAGFIMVITYIIYITEEKYKLKEEAEQIKKEQIEARLIALQQQLSPHFLFNALNTLHSIASDKATKNYVVQFSNVFRYLLDTNQASLVSLEEELNFTKSYLHILHERFEDALKVDLDIPAAYLSYKLPPICLQILIENAIKHNIVAQDSPLEIQIFCQDKEMLVVKNTLQSKSSVEESTGKGLTNIRERYLLLLGKNIEIEVTENYFKVSIPLIKN